MDNLMRKKREELAREYSAREPEAADPEIELIMQNIVDKGSSGEADEKQSDLMKLLRGLPRARAFGSPL